MHRITMPLFDDAIELIRANPEQLQQGSRAKLVAIATLTKAQLDAFNQERYAHSWPPIVAEVVFIGRHVYESRVTRDGYSIDDVIDRIASAMAAEAISVPNPRMTAMENPNLRTDRYGNSVRDRAVFECSARHPRGRSFFRSGLRATSENQKATHGMSGLLFSSGSSG